MQTSLIQIRMHTIFHLITAHTPISAVKKFRSLQITASVLFSLLLYKGICCGYSFELHRLVDAIQMSSHNICLYKENQKKIALSSLNKSFSDFL